MGELAIELLATFVVATVFWTIVFTGILLAFKYHECHSWRKSWDWLFSENLAPDPKPTDRPSSTEGLEESIEQALEALRGKRTFAHNDQKLADVPKAKRILRDVLRRLQAPDTDEGGGG